MESSLTESTQQLVRPGKCTDVYYPDPQTAQKQCWRTSTNTRYVQDFTNKGGGSSTFTISPNNGVQDVALILTLPAASSFPTGNSTKLGVCRGWGYAAIKQISFRYAGSSQYFLSGQQVLQAALAQCTDSGSRDAILSLGGDALTNDGVGGDGFASQKSAYVWLPLPHCVPSSAGKLPPLPSDLNIPMIACC